MGDRVLSVEYFYLTVSNKPGEAARVLAPLEAAGISLLAFSGFPRGRQAQIDFVPADVTAFKQVARREKWKLTGPRRAFLVQGEDRVGAVKAVVEKLSGAGINVTAVDALCAGADRYGAIVWVKPADYRKAAKLIATPTETV